MTAHDLLAQLRELGVKLTSSGADRLVIDAPKGVITSELRRELSANKAELLRILQTPAEVEPARTSESDTAPDETVAIESRSFPVSTPPPGIIPNHEVARLETELNRLRTEEQARRAEAEAARVFAENALRAEQERWQQAEHDTALRRAEKQRHWIEIEARERGTEETRRRFADDEIRRAEDEVERMRQTEESRREDFEARMRAGDDAHRLQLESLRKAEEDQARRRIEEERRYLEVMASNKTAEDELRRSAEQQMQAVEEQILRIRAEEAARQQAVEETRRLAQDTARRLAEEDARRLAAAEAERRAEEEARMRAEIESQIRAEDEARSKSEDAVRRRTEEHARKRAQDEAQRLADLETRRQAEAETRRHSEEMAGQRAAEEAKRKAEEQGRREAEAEQRLRAEAETRERAEAAIRERQALEKRIRAEVEAKLRAEKEERNHAGDGQGSIRSSSRVTKVSANSGDAVSNAKEPSDEFRAVSVPESRTPEESATYASTLSALTSERADERARGVAGLPGIGGEEAFQYICDAFDDPSAEVRTVAARALSAFQRDRAAAFTRALREAQPERHQRIAAAMASSGLANEAIESLTGDNRDQTYDAFSLLFIMSKAGEIQPLMRTIEEHPNADLRLAAIKVLALSGQHQILPAFRQMATDGALPPEVHSALTEAIAQLSSQSRAESASG